METYVNRITLISVYVADHGKIVSSIYNNYLLYKLDTIFSIFFVFQPIQGSFSIELAQEGFQDLYTTDLKTLPQLTTFTIY